MPQSSRKKSKKSKKKSGRVSSVPLPSGSSGIYAVDSRQDSTEFENAGAGPSRSDEPPTPSVPDNSSLKSHGSQLPTRQPRSENNVVESSPFAALPAPNQVPLRQPPHQPVPALQPGHDPGVSRSPGSTTSFLTGASGFQMGDINHNYYEAPRGGSGARDNSIDGWELLLKNTATNALHDSDARYDAPKCDEDTRIEVTREIMDVIQAHDGTRRLLCMTGAAGSGKSTLQQTIAGICEDSGILGSAFFFLASDSTRNTVKRVVPTIAYQLGRSNDTLRLCIKAAVEKDRLIFSKSLQAQMSTLIVQPSQRCEGMGTDLTTLPYAILIDGLDECTDEDRQSELLTAVKECLLNNRLPFRVFIASRPEWAIRTALEPGGHLCKMAYHIRLSDQYDASADMRRYLQRRFEDIGLRINDPEWFSEGDIEILVTAGSGQFIYVAVVYKYISQRRASPAERLKIVLTWTPHEGQATRPFEALDRLYTNILLAAKNAYEAVDSHHGRDFLLLFRAYHLHATGPAYIGWRGLPKNIGAGTLSALLRLEPRAEEILLSDVRSLVTLKKKDSGDSGLRLYHKSFSDFLEQSGRAKDLFVPESRVDDHLSKCSMQHIIQHFDSLRTKRDSEVLHAIQHLPSFLYRANAIDDEVVEFTEKGGWQKINDVFLRLIGSSTVPVAFHGWEHQLRHFTSTLKRRKPETAAVMSVFVEKWGMEPGRRPAPKTNLSPIIDNVRISRIYAESTLHDLHDDGDFFDDLEPKPPVRSKKDKNLEKWLGTEYADKVGADSRPWYLRPNYEGSEIIIEADGSVRGGTVTALVERLTAHEHLADRTYTEAFLMTFKSFTTVEELTELLIERFRIQPPEGLTPAELDEWSKLKQKVIQIRVMNAFKSIVTSDDVLEKEDMYVLDKIDAFVSSEHASAFPAAKQIKKLIEQRIIDGSNLKSLVNTTLSPPPPPIVPKNIKKLRLTDVEPLELARQLTIMESQLYQRIKPMECLQRAREQKTENMDNIAVVIQTSNKIADWVADLVLSKEDSKRRAAIVKHLISVADRCRTLNNFSSMIAITSGLNTPPIRRLKRTWEQVGQRYMAQFGACEMTIDSNKNFTKYRQLMAAVTPPCVPFIGVFLSTLQFIQDGNPDNLPGGLVNFRKRQKASEVISDIKRWQTQSFNLQQLPVVFNFIEESLNQFSDTKASSDIFWQLSLEREPREREDEKMARLLQESGFL